MYAASLAFLHASIHTSTCSHHPPTCTSTHRHVIAPAYVCSPPLELCPCSVCPQGFASGDLERDAASLRTCAAMGLEMMLAQSFAKNMGL